jgi:hypothetical protein
MDADVARMESQLTVWGATIDRLLERTLRPGIQISFENLNRIDVLKALHVIVTAKCVEYEAASEADRARIWGELTVIWSELAEAIRPPRPPSKS